MPKNTIKKKKKKLNPITVILIPKGENPRKKDELINLDMLDMLEVCRCGWKMLPHTSILFSLQILVNNIDSLLS